MTGDFGLAKAQLVDLSPPQGPPHASDWPTGQTRAVIGGAGIGAGPEGDLHHGRRAAAARPAELPAPGECGGPDPAARRLPRLALGHSHPPPGRGPRAPAPPGLRAPRRPPSLAPWCRRWVHTAWRDSRARVTLGSCLRAVECGPRCPECPRGLVLGEARWERGSGAHPALGRQRGTCARLVALTHQHSARAALLLRLTPWAVPSSPAVGASGLGAVPRCPCAPGRRTAPALRWERAPLCSRLCQSTRRCERGPCPAVSGEAWGLSLPDLSRRAPLQVSRQPPAASGTIAVPSVPHRAARQQRDVWKPVPPGAPRGWLAPLVAPWAPPCTTHSWRGSRCLSAPDPPEGNVRRRRAVSGLPVRGDRQYPPRVPAQGPGRLPWASGALSPEQRGVGGAWEPRRPQVPDAPEPGPGVGACREGTLSGS